MGGPQVNKFEQVLSLDHQMSLTGVKGRCMRFLYGEERGQDWDQHWVGGPLVVRSKGSWVMFTWDAL